MSETRAIEHYECGWCHAPLGGKHEKTCTTCPANEDVRRWQCNVVDAAPVTALEALKARLRQEVDAHRMTLHVRALPFTDEEWQGYLGTIPGLEEGARP